MQQGTHAGKNILRMTRGEKPLPFRYWDRGSFAVIGRGAAVGDAFSLRMSGFLAWVAWLVIHIFFLIGFRNRIAVLFNWAYSFFTLRRNAQLITGENVESLPRLTKAEPRESVDGSPRGSVPLATR